MGSRQRVMKRSLQLRDRAFPCGVFRRNAVRDERFQSAQPHPLIEQPAISKALGRDLFVVTLQEYALTPLIVRDQPIDRLARRWTPVDVVAQKNIERPCDRAGSD